MEKRISKNENPLLFISIEDKDGFRYGVQGNTLEELAKGVVTIGKVPIARKFIKKFSKAKISDETKKQIKEFVIKSKNSNLIYEYAKYIKEGNSDDYAELEDAMIETEDVDMLYSLMCIDGTNTSKISDAIIVLDMERNSSKYLLAIAKLKETDIKKVEDALINSKDYFSCVDFAKNIKKANKKKIKNFLLEERNPRALVLFAEYVEKEGYDELEDAIIEIGENYYIIEFCQNVEKANIQKFEDAVIKKGDPKFIQKFEREVHGVDKNKLKKAYKKAKRLRK